MANKEAASRSSKEPQAVAVGDKLEWGDQRFTVAAVDFPLTVTVTDWSGARIEIPPTLWLLARFHPRRGRWLLPRDPRRGWQARWS